MKSAIGKGINFKALKNKPLDFFFNALISYHHLIGFLEVVRIQEITYVIIITVKKPDIGLETLHLYIFLTYENIR